jgi:hypothetical protein
MMKLQHLALWSGGGFVPPVEVAAMVVLASCNEQLQQGCHSG